MTQPYYQDKWVTIYCDDYRNAEWLVSDKAYLITDPPYGISYDPSWIDKTQSIGKQRRYRTNIPVSKGTGKMKGDDQTLDLSVLFDYPKRLIWGHPYIYDAEATGWLVWDKMTNIDLPEDRLRAFSAPVEVASTTLWSGFKLIRNTWFGFFKEHNEHRYDHPTQKALKVFLYPIANYTKPNDLVIDLFLGTGTCAVAAKKLNRKFIGYEIEEKYCKIAANRCRQDIMLMEGGEDNG